MMDEYFGSINDDPRGGIPLLEKLWHVCVDKFSRRPQGDLQVEKVYPTREDPRDC